jgi:coenzyme PQQ precursor peptide PqqA
LTYANILLNRPKNWPFVLHTQSVSRKLSGGDGQFAQSFAGKSLFAFGSGQSIDGRGSVPSNMEGTTPMSWTTPTLVEVCIGLEINGYMPADGYVPPEF